MILQVIHPLPTTTPAFEASQAYILMAHVPSHALSGWKGRLEFAARVFRGISRGNLTYTLIFQFQIYIYLNIYLEPGVDALPDILATGSLVPNI